MPDAPAYRWDVCRKCFREAYSSVRYPVTMESVRHAAWKLHSSNGLAMEVRRLDDYQVAAVPDRVVDVGQIPAGEFARVRVGRSEHGLARSTGLSSGTERMLLGSTAF